MKMNVLCFVVCVNDNTMKTHSEHYKMGMPRKKVGKKKLQKKKLEYLNQQE